MWITIVNPSTSTARGDGPIITATGWQREARLSKAGAFSFEMPAADSRAADLAQKDEVYCFDLVNGAVTQLGAGIVESIETIVGEPSMLRVTGPDLLGELMHRTVDSLELYDVETAGATAVSHVWRYGDGTIYSSDLMAEAYDDNPATVYQIDIGLKSWNYLYVGAATPISACTIDFTNTSTAASGTLAAQYFDGSAWQTLTISSDGTHDGTRTLGQDGKIAFVRPSDQAMTTHDGVAAYWARLWPDVDTTDAIYIAEVDVDQDCETLDGLADIMDYAPAGWSIDDSGEGYAGTQNGAYMQFAGETVLEALAMLAEHTGEQFRVGTGKTIEWLQDDPDAAPVASGYRAIYGVDPLAVDEVTTFCLIDAIAETVESYERCTRVYPYGATVGTGRITLEYCSETPPAGYTLSTSANYIKHDANDTANRIERTLSYPEAGQAEEGAAHGEMASNELYQVAVEYLQRHVDDHHAYTLRLIGLQGAVEPGQSVDVVCHDYAGGVHAVNIDNTLIILEATTKVDEDGVRTVGLTVSTTDVWPQDEQAMVVRELRNARRRASGGGGGGGVGGAEDLALNSVILLKQGSEYPLVYSLDGEGFAAAILAAGSRDAIWVGAGTVTGDHTIPVHVSVSSMPFSRTAFTGCLTLSDGVVLNGLELHRVADQAGDLVAIVPPASGMAYCGYCWIVAENATGAGYAVSGDCENVTLRDCYVSAQSAGVDANPFSGGADPTWPYAVYAATQTLGVYYTDDSLDPGEAQPVWSTVNTGLSNTTLRSFCLDRHEDPPDTRMFCIDETAHALYRRTGGDWAVVLSSADARTVAGASDSETLMSVAVDPVTGYVYALLWREAATCIIACLRSVDHGDNWTSVTVRARDYTYNASNVDAYDGLVVCHSIDWPLGSRVNRSTNHGASWTSVYDADSQSDYAMGVRIHPAAGTTWYANIYDGTPGNTYELHRCNTAGATDVMLSGQHHGPWTTPGGFWMDPDDPLHLLVATRQQATQIMESSDAGASQDSDVATSVEYMHEIGDGCVEDYWVQGCSAPRSVTPTPPARAPVYVSTDGVTLTNRSGTNFDTAPYTNAIPVTCGGITPWGLWLVASEAGSTGTPYLEGCVVPNLEGREAGLPEYGDRAAWRTNYDGGAAHADDWELGDSHHAEVTIGLDVETIFDLTGQTLTFDEQDANTVLAGPESGASAVPTFRALVAADLPAIEDHDHSGDAGDGGTFDAANLTSGASTDGQVLTSDGGGGAAWEDITVETAELLMQDGVTAPPVPLETEDQDDWLYED